MNDKYKLDAAGEPVPVSDFMEWARWFETKEAQAERVVRQEKVGDVKVSTVFLSLDHSWGEGPPVLWESMIFGGPHDGYQERCTGNRADALRMHEIAVAVAKGERQPEPL